MKSKKSLNNMLKLQKEFDLQHKGRIDFFEKIDENNIEALEHLIVCMVGEIGEFANIVKKIRRGDFSFQEKKEELSEELADVFIYLLKIANQADIDLEKEFFIKLEKNTKRFEKYKK